MKKIFSLFAAVLFAGSMMAQVTILPTDFTPVENSDYSVTKDGVTVAVTASTVTNEQMRIFKGKTITISAESNISSIEFTCTANGTAKYGPGCFNAQEGYTYEADGKKGTWTGSAISVTFTAESNQVRATQIVVTVGGEPVVVDTYTVAGNEAAIFGEAWNPALEANDMKKVDGIYTWEKAELELTPDDKIEFKVVKNHSWDVAFPASNFEISADEEGVYTLKITFDPLSEGVEAVLEGAVVLADPTNCAEAAEAALSVSANNELYNDGKEYTIEGYVTSIASAFNPSYNNVSFWMADEKEGANVLQAYRAACAAEADAPHVGDKVAVTGKLTKYGTTPEFAQGCTFVILERAEYDEPVNLGEKTIAEFLELKNMVDTCILTGAIANVKNDQYGNFDLVDETGSVYVYGLLTAAGESKKCFQEEGLAEGDILTVLAIYGEYNQNPQVKNAIFVSVEKHQGQGIEETATDAKAVKVVRNGQVYILRGDKTFNLIGAEVK